MGYVRPTEPQTHFRILGPLEAEVEGRAVPLGGPKQRALLAILLLHANEVVSTDDLIERLWGEHPPDSASKALQVHVSQLRKALEPHRLLVTRPTGYLAEVGPGELDVEEFEARVVRAREALAAGREGEASAGLHGALELWHGPPLADFAFESFAQAEIARLQELRLAAVESRVAADLALGRHADVIGELEALVAEHPLREELRAQLMLALYRCGRQAEALESYRAGRAALVEELGIEPGRPLRERHEAILRQDPGLDLPSPAKPAEDPARGGFVGRDEQLAELLAGLEDARGGSGRTFLVPGEPGIGKSRFADEVTARTREVGATVLWGRCWEAEGAPAYWPWVQALRAHIRDTDPDRLRAELRAGASDVAQMLPELREVLPDLEPAAAASPERARFRLFDATAAFLRAAAEAAPLVLVLDDMHAADTPSLLLLRFLAPELRDSRVVLLVAYRDTEAGPDHPLNLTVAELRRDPSTRTLLLGGLSVSEVGRCIETITAEATSEEIARAVHRETEGNPLFVSELVRLLASEGRLEEAAADPWRASIPQGMHEVIAHRLHQLSPGCRRLLSVASVLGRESRLDVLEHLGAVSEDELLDLLDEARAARVIGDRPGGHVGMRFSHALIRDSLYGELGRSERLRLHRRAAESLEAVYGQQVEPHLAELAHHYLEAGPGGDADKAIDYARRAGDRAAAQLAYEESARFFEMALSAAGRHAPSDVRLRCRLLLALGDAQARGGDTSSWKDTFADAADAARALGDPELLAQAAVGYGGRFVWFRSGADRRLIPLLESALEALPEPHPFRVRLLARLAGALRDHPVAQRRASLTREAVEIAETLGDPATLAYAVEGTYSALSAPREAAAWMAMAQQLIGLAEETGDPELAFAGHTHAWGAHMGRCDVAEADEELSIMTSVAREMRQPAQLWALVTTQACRACLAGRFDEAEALVDETRRLRFGGHEGLSGVDDSTYFYVHHLQDFVLWRERGRGDVRAAIEEYASHYPPIFVFRSVLANVYAQLGLEAEARAELDRLGAGGFAGLDVGTEWLFGAGLLAEVCARVGAAQHAERLYEALAPYPDSNVMGHPEICLGSASRYLGLLAATMGRWDAAGAHFEHALEVNARMGARPWVARTQYDYGAMLIANGDPERGQDLVREALRTYRELGMQTWGRAAAG